MWLAGEQLSLYLYIILNTEVSVSCSEANHLLNICICKIYAERVDWP